MKKKNIKKEEIKTIELDPSVERILNQDEDWDFDYENESFDIPFESAMEP